MSTTTTTKGAADETSFDWLFDYICAFLRSPPWTVPLNNFIDRECIIFDNEDENQFIHSSCHTVFKSLIESLLEQNLTAIGISNEQFITACEQGQNSQHEANKLIFGQILACEDYLTFKKMMYARNMELQLEATEAIQNYKPESTEEEDIQLQLALVLSQQSDSNVSRINKPAQNDIEAALKLSIVDQERAEAEFQREQAELEHAIALSLAIEAERLRAVEELLEQQKEDQLKAIEESKRLAAVAAAAAESIAAIVKQQPVEPVVDTAKAAAAPVAAVKAETVTPAVAAVATDNSKSTATTVPATVSPPKSTVTPSTVSAAAAPAIATVTVPTKVSAPKTLPSLSALPPLVHKSSSLATNTSTTTTAVAPVPTASELKQLQSTHKANVAAAEALFSANAATARQSKALQQSKSNIPADELARRQEFLRQQREILLKRKEAERSNELAAFTQANNNPQSSTAASGTTAAVNITDPSIQLRSQLAARLKSDFDAVIDRRTTEAQSIMNQSVTEQLAAAERMRIEKQSRAAAEAELRLQQEQQRQQSIQQLTQKLAANKINAAEEQFKL